MPATLGVLPPHPSLPVSVCAVHPLASLLPSSRSCHFSHCALTSRFSLTSSWLICSATSLAPSPRGLGGFPILSSCFRSQSFNFRSDIFEISMHPRSCWHIWNLWDTLLRFACLILYTTSLNFARFSWASHVRQFLRTTLSHTSTRASRRRKFPKNKWPIVRRKTCPERVLPSTSGFFSARDEAKSSHSTLHTSHCTLRTPNFKLHTPHFTLHTPHFTLHSPHFTLLTSHCFLHTPNLTLHTSHFTLHTALFALQT